MDNLLEIILPLIFFAIYFVSQFFGKKSGEDSDPQQEPPDDLRKIREELRRKIQERRKESSHEYVREEKPAEPQKAHGGSVLRESQPQREMVERRSHTPRSQQPAPGNIPDRSASQMEADLEAQMEAVRLSQKKAESARREARARVASIAKVSAKGRSPKSPASYRQFLRESLKDPQNLQKSFILHEVFGTPVGMRRDGQMRPSHDL
ncbi:MAG: hypothetical protein ACQKBT_07555 [Puniceicoccales bacterium]